MRNRLKELLKRGDPAFGCWLTFPSPGVAELLADQQPDWLLIDTEHGAIDDETVEDMIRAIRAASPDVVPLVRVMANDAGLIKKALDRGALGVIVPLVNSPEEAHAAVAACRYPPDGIRGVAGTRASRHGADLPAYFARWNEDVFIGCQIETRPALANVDAIASVPGVDMLFVGPNDLSASLGVFRQFDHPDYLRAVGRIIEAGRRAGVAIGYMTRGAEEAVARVREGVQFVSITTDARLLMGAASAAFQAFRREAGR